VVAAQRPLGQTPNAGKGTVEVEGSDLILAENWIVFFQQVRQRQQISNRTDVGQQVFPMLTEQLARGHATTRSRARFKGGENLITAQLHNFVPPVAVGHSESMFCVCRHGIYLRFPLRSPLT